MDVLTHAFVPYAAATAARRPLRERLAAAIGGAAPDADVLLGWVPLMADGAYALGHRGASHTVWGAPLLGAVALLLLSRPALAARWPRLSPLSLQAGTWIALVLGAWSHLLLDAVTVTGVPALWPLTPERFGAPRFFYVVPALLLPSGYGLYRLARGTLADGDALRLAAILLALVAAFGGLRLLSYPEDVPPGASVVPTPNDLRWIIVRPVGGDIEVHDLTLGRPGAQLVYQTRVPAEAARAVEACRATGTYKGWAWDRWGAEVVVAEPTGAGAWRVTFEDAAQAYLRATSGDAVFRRLGGDPDDPDRLLRCRVEEGRVTSAMGPQGWVASALQAAG